MRNKSDILTGGSTWVFLRYAIPTTIGMLAISSALVIDGIFVGNIIGAQALAAVNLTMPYFSVWSSAWRLCSVSAEVLNAAS